MGGYRRRCAQRRPPRAAFRKEVKVRSSQLGKDPGGVTQDKQMSCSGSKVGAFLEQNEGARSCGLMGKGRN